MQVVQQLIVALGQRARTHQRHVAAHHVEQLRQLVDGEPAEELAHLGHARVVADLEQCAVGLVAVLKLNLQLVGPHAHGAELEAIERVLLNAHAAAAVEHRAAVGEPHRQRRQREDGRQQHDEQRAHHQVEPALGQEGDAAEHRRAELEQRQSRGGHGTDGVRQELRGGGCQAHGDSAAAAHVEQVENWSVAAGGAGEDDLVHLLWIEQCVEFFCRRALVVGAHARDEHVCADHPVGHTVAVVAGTLEALGDGAGHIGAPHQQSAAFELEPVEHQGGHAVPRGPQHDDQHTDGEPRRVEHVEGLKAPAACQHQRQHDDGGDGDRRQDARRPAALAALAVQVVLGKYQHHGDGDDGQRLLLHRPDRTAVHRLPGDPQLERQHGVEAEECGGHINGHQRGH